MKQQELENWWYEDHFAWDYVLDVEVLDEDRIVLVTPIGPVVVSVPGSGVYPILRMWPLRGLDYCGPGCIDGDRVGIAVGKSNGGRHYLIKGIPGNPAWLSAHDLDSPRLCRPRVSLGYKPADTFSPTRYIGMTETWLRYDPSKPDAPPGALTSHLPALPDELISANGQFCFDRALGACGFPSRAGEWLVFTDLPCSTSTAGLFCRNRLQTRQERAARSGLVLLDVWRSAAVPGAIRNAREHNAFFCLFAEPSQQKGGDRILRAQLADQKLTWDSADFKEAPAAFMIGHQVHLALGGLTWSHKDLYLWDGTTATAPLVLDAPDYPLFVDHQGGLALAFDIMNSLSLDRST